MLSLLSYGYAFLQLLLYFALPQISLSARIPIHPLPHSVFYSTFNIYTPTGKGGCFRNAPNGVPMMTHTLGSLGGTSAVAQTVAQNLPNYPTETYIRALLFLFFGITFQANHQLNPDADNVNAFRNITNTFAMVNNLFENPRANAYGLKPRYRCLEDYASYCTHDIGTDGRQNMSGPLIGEVWRVDGGSNRPAPYNDIWPGLMYVYNDNDRTDAWYMPNPASPQTGQCGVDSGAAVTVAFTQAAFFRKTGSEAIVAKALYGITKCASHFTRPLLMNLGTPIANGGLAEVVKFVESSDLVDLHELIHLVSDRVIIDQPAMQPPTEDGWLTNRDWATWTLDPVYNSYGYLRTVFLGLASPALARLNADNWSKFSGCMYYPELDCVGNFQEQIRTKRSIPFGLSPRAVEKIRSGRFDLRRDLPMDADLELRPAEGGTEDEFEIVSGERRTEDGFERGFEERGQSRIGDGDVPSSLFG